MKPFQITLDKLGFKTKPTSEDVSKIQLRLRENSIVTITPRELLDFIGNGCTIVPAAITNGIKRENFISQQLIMLDFDNAEDGDLLSPSDAISLFQEHGLSPFAWYNTFSSTPEKQKFRLLFMLDNPINDINQMEFILKTLIDFAPQVDKACKNVSRLFYGTNRNEKDVVLLDENATISFDDIIKIYRPISDTYITTNEVIEDGEFDLKSSVKNYDLLGYMKKENNYLYTSGDYSYFDTCVICGHNNCLRHHNKTNTFFCYGANGNKGGTILDYLMYSKNITIKEAIDYFKYELLKLPKQEKKRKELNKKYLPTVINQLNSKGLDDSVITEVNWISQKKYKGETIDYIICPLLAEYLRHNLHYIFVRNSTKSGILRYFYLDGYYKQVNDDEIKGLIMACIPLKLQSIRVANEVLNQLYTDLRFVPIDELNADENIINFQNGVLHLDTMELKPHSPEYLSTIRIPCNYKEDVESPSTHYFDNFLNTLTDGDEEIKQLLLQIIGVIISNVPGYRMKQALFMVGPGNTGKSVLKLLLTILIGPENCCSMDLKSLENRFSKIQLLNKRLVGSNDMSYMTVSEMCVFKEATGGDPINAEFKGENAIDFIFKGVLWFSGNTAPKFGGDRGDWVYKRILLVECNNIIEDDKQDKNLVNHLLEEKEYIISLAVKGLKQVIKNGYKYNIPKICQKLIEKYKTTNNSFLTFMEECLVERDGSPIKDECTCGYIYNIYKMWAKDNCNGYTESKQEVKKILEKLGKADKIKTNGGQMYYKDLIVNDDTRMEYDEMFRHKKQSEANSYYNYDTGVGKSNYNF